MLVVRVHTKASPAGEELEPSLLSEALARREGVVWVEARNPTREEVALLAEELQLHPVAVEDILHGGQRPKVEPYQGFVFVVLHSFEVRDGEITPREVHCLLGDGYLATLVQGSSPDFQEARSAVAARPDLLQEGAAFLLYAVLDTVVDSYFAALDAIEAELERVEAVLFSDRPDLPVEEELFGLRRKLLEIRRSLLPARDALSLLGGPGGVATPRLEPYFRDVADHVMRALETAETLREMLTSTLEAHLTAVSNRLNLVMKKLTAWGAIILVPTLIAGIYGMNFTRMPELSWPWGYPFALALMASSALILYAIFKRKGWI